MADIKSHVILTEKIKRWIRTILLTADLPNDTREELRKYTSGRRSADEKKRRTIPFELVKTVHKYLQAEQGLLTICQSLHQCFDEKTPCQLIKTCVLSTSYIT